MTKYTKKPAVVEAITFDELIEHGRSNGASIIKGMPWSMDYKGHQITREDDDHYLIPTLEGNMRMSRNDMLITGVNGEIYPCKIEIFQKTYDRATSKNQRAHTQSADTSTTALDTQEGGDHYKSLPIQPVQFITANNIGFIEGNVIKYVCRHQHKNGAEDIKKAIHYLNLLLELKYQNTQ